MGSTWQVERGERVCLLGRNGEGKSTLLRLIRGELEPDEGEVIRQQGLRIARLPQEVPEGRGGTVADEVAEGLDEAGHAAARRRPPGRGGPLPDGAGPRRPVRGPLLGDEAARPAGPGPRRRARHPPARRADQPPRHRGDPLAGGLPAALRRDAGLRHPRPGVPGAGWPPGSSSSTGAGSTTGPATTRPSSKRKEELLAAEDRQDALFDKKLAQEEVWIRKGIEARRTRNEGRVRALKAMREARAAAARAPGHGPDAGPGGRAVRHPGHRGQGGRLRLRRPPGDPRT